MPMGAPAYTVPKSGCRDVDEPMLPTYVDDLASTGSLDTSACQKLSAGNIGQFGASGTGEPLADVNGNTATGRRRARARAQRRRITVFSLSAKQPANL